MLVPRETLSSASTTGTFPVSARYCSSFLVFGAVSVATINNLAGFCSYAERSTGSKVSRADPYSVQVNNGNVWLLRAEWNKDFIEEHRLFPFAKLKDQVDAASGAFSKVSKVRKVAGAID